MLVFELVFKALSRSKSFSLIFILNFTLAIAALSYLQFFKSSIDTSLETKAKSLLGADLVISSRFPISSEQMEELKDNGYPQQVIDKYKEVGGTPWLDFHHTVFGEITDGTDVLEDIASTRTGMGDKPVYDVVIETIEIEE